MSGFRIRHREVTNRILTIVDPVQPYTLPYACPTCHLTHVFKTYHVELDDEGSAIVSLEVWSHIQRIPAHGLQLMNEVVKPPPNVLSFDPNRMVPGSGREIERG